MLSLVFFNVLRYSIPTHKRRSRPFILDQRLTPSNTPQGFPRYVGAVYITIFEALTIINPHMQKLSHSINFGLLFVSASTNFHSCLSVLSSQ